MTSDRIQCPNCRENVIGYVRVQGGVAYRYNHCSENVITVGVIHCRCRAAIVVVAGVVTGWTAPVPKPKEIDDMEVDYGTSK